MCTSPSHPLSTAPLPPSPLPPMTLNWFSVVVHACKHPQPLTYNFHLNTSQPHITSMNLPNYTYTHTERGQTHSDLAGWAHTPAWKKPLWEKPIGKNPHSRKITKQKPLTNNKHNVLLPPSSSEETHDLLSG